MISQKLKASYAQASRWAFPFMIIAAAFLLWNGCQKDKALSTLQADFEAQAAHTQQIENERGQQVAENEQLKADNAGDVKALTDSIFALKRSEAKKVKEVENYARIVQEYKRREFLAGWTEPDSPYVADTNVGDIQKDSTQPVIRDTSNMIRVPRGFAYAAPDSSTYMRGRVTRAGVQVDSIGIRNTLHFRTVEKSAGFLGLGRVTTVQAVNSNPNVTNLSITSVQVRHRPGWFNRWGKLALGLAAGAAGVHYLTR